MCCLIQDTAMTIASANLPMEMLTVVHSIEALDTNFKVFGWMWPGFKTSLTDIKTLAIHLDLILLSGTLMYCIWPISDHIDCVCVCVCIFMPLLCRRLSAENRLPISKLFLCKSSLLNVMLNDNNEKIIQMSGKKMSRKKNWKKKWQEKKIEKERYISTTFCSSDFCVNCVLCLNVRSVALSMVKQCQYVAALLRPLLVIIFHGKCLSPVHSCWYHFNF